MPARRAGLANTGRDPCSPLSSDHKNRFGRTWRKGGFFILRVLQGGHGPVAQLDRVADFYSAGCRFESCRDRHSPSMKPFSGSREAGRKQRRGSVPSLHQKGIRSCGISSTNCTGISAWLASRRCGSSSNISEQARSMDNGQPLVGAILTAMVIAAVVWVTIGPPPGHKEVSSQHQTVARR